MNKEAIIAKAAGAFGKVQALVAGYRLFLLKKEPHSSRLVSIYEITIPFWSRWSTFREQTIFMWADSSDEWANRVAQTSFVGYGEPDTDGQIDVYSISPEQRDRVKPSGSNLIWKLYGVREGSLRFTIPVPPETP